MDTADVVASARKEGGQLQVNAVGLREVLFQSITDMAPGAAIAASIPAGAAFAGGSLPLSVILALVASLLCASCVGELAARIPSAGSLATYAAKGLHPTIGFLVGWGYAFAALLVPPLVLVQLGFTVAPTLHQQWAAYPADLWWPWALLGAAIICLAGLFGVRTSARLGSILGAFEIAVFVAAGVLFVVHAGSHNTLSVFTAKYTAKGYRGFNGIFAGSVFTVLAFAGFEAAAPLGEEASNPRRTVRRAVLGATVAIGVLYVFTTYAASVAFGPARFTGFGGSGPASWEGLSRAFYGIMWVFVFFAIVNSTVANANAGVTVSSRTSFALSRVGVLPSAFSRLSVAHRAPWVAILMSTVVTVGLTLGLGLGYGTTNAFNMLGTGIVIVLAAIYIVVDAACLGYFLRRRSELNVFLHVVVPVLGIIAFIPAWLSAAGIRAFKFISPLAPPVSYMAYGVAGWMVIGLVYLVYHQAAHPRRVTAVGTVHLDLAPEEM
ncbi:MAG TPA: APC family permease [Acidimicrobiales bacterium]|nr:APC family permease [Acidimicrobiales bacterium]